MSETVKTLSFAAVAVVAVVVAVFTYPKQKDYRPPDMVGKSMFEKFTDPGDAAELAIAKFSEDLGQLTQFEVARNASGIWTIPSSSNYPADAEAQMRDAATSLIDLRVLGLATSETRDHQIYGVIEPDSQKLDASQEGVGLLVAVKNSKGDALARLIIGKRVKGTEDQYFVRKPGEPQVYVVKIDPEKFPTEFEKWIERNLLKINTLDVERVTLKDYSRLNELPEDSIVLSTGDPMLAGLGHLGEEVVPGISSMQCAFSRLRLPLTKAVVVDAHGKDEDVARREMVEEVERGRIPFVLTEPGFDIIALCHVMQEKGLKCKVIACENLGYADEIISFGDTTRPPMITSRLFSLILVGEGCR